MYNGYFINGEIEMSVEKRIKELKKLISILEQEYNSTQSESNDMNQWEPEGGEHFIYCDGNVCWGESSDECKAFGIERPTKELADKAAICMRKMNRLLAYKDEYAPGYEFGDNVRNASFYIDDNDKYAVEYTLITINPFAIYFPEDVAKDLCRKLNNGEVVL